MKAILSSIFGNFLKGLDHFCLGNLIASSRGYDHFVCFCFVLFLPKYFDMQTWPIFEGNKWSNPKGASVHCLFFMHVYLELGQAICWFYLHTNPRSIMA